MSLQQRVGSAGLVLLLAVLAAPVARAAEGAATIPELERARSANPRSVKARDDLGQAYYTRAREHLDHERYGDYEGDLSRAMDEWIAETGLIELKQHGLTVHLERVEEE